MEDKNNENFFLDQQKQKRYRSGVGIFLYLVKFSRPDISNSVRELSKAMDRATESHYLGLLRVLRFVLMTQNLGLIYDSGILINFLGIWKIVAYGDSDFGDDKDNRISVTVFCI